MAARIPGYYWDTCVFIAYLNGDRKAYGSAIDDIQQFLRDAKEDKCIIYCSTLTVAEITQDKMRNQSRGGFSKFLNDFSTSIIPLDPDMNIMETASELRSLHYTKTGGIRKLHTPDAIHLASAITLTETYNVSLEAFHTFDKGGSRGIEGRAVPLLGFEAWCEECLEDRYAQKVIGLNRCEPQHPWKELALR